MYYPKRCYKRYKNYTANYRALFHQRGFTNELQKITKFYILQMRLTKYYKVSAINLILF